MKDLNHDNINITLRLRKDSYILYRVCYNEERRVFVIITNKNRYFEETNGNNYLILILTDVNKDDLEKYVTKRHS